MLRFYEVGENTGVYDHFDPPLNPLLVNKDKPKSLGTLVPNSRIDMKKMATEFFALQNML